MSSCPSCQQNIEVKSQHMGALFTCPHCRAVFFIGWDGQPEAVVQHEPEPVEPEPVFEPAMAAAESTPFQTESYESPAMESPLESPLEMPSQPDFSAPADSGFSPAADFPVTEEAAESPIANFPETPPYEQEASALENAPSFTPETSPSFEAPPTADENPAESFMGGESFEDAAAVAAGAAVAASGNFGDVERYANQETLSGPLAYTIVIKGLELAETFERLREALTDSRFHWEVDEVMSKVKAGRLEMTGLNPTKASILINRIKYLPIEVSWKQEVYGGTS